MVLVRNGVAVTRVFMCYYCSQTIRNARGGGGGVWDGIRSSGAQLPSV